MNKLQSLILAQALLFTSFRVAASDGPGAGRLDYVNILQGTDSRPERSHGNTLPLVGMPWGMVDWSLENGTGEWYFRPNGRMDGFRATHQPSPWIGDYGQFVLMPQSGKLEMSAGDRWSEYDTNSSVLRPDYEKMELTRGHITAELTGTERCGLFRLTYHEGETGRLIIDAAGASEIQIKGRTIRGLSRANRGGVSKNFASYFVIQLDHDISAGEVYAGEKSTGPNSGQGEHVSAWVEFKTTASEPVGARVGTSLISWEQAEQNLRAEAEGGFDAVRARVQKTWESNLGRVEIEADNNNDNRTFYSCLYRAQLFPHRLYELDANGKAIHYSPYDGEIHDGVLYGDIGIWDAFRTTFPLITVLYPDQLNEILQGFVNASREGGSLPEWPSPGYRDCMIGQHCAAIFADAVAKGETNFDVPKAYASLRKSAFEPPRKGELVRRGLAEYLKLGYIPDGASTYAVAATLDYAYDDWCVAQIARHLNETGDFNVLMERARNYRLLWDPSVGFMRPKNDQGKWIEPFDQYAWGGPYAEGGPWQNSWFAPQDSEGLAALAGGREKLLEKLDRMLGLPPVFHVGGYGGVIHEMTEMGVAKFGQYAHSNQPVFDVLYLFAAMGEPWKTEYWTRRICAEMYNDGVDGFAGDEDNGSMASWYLLSAMGFYPLCPGTTEYVYTSPAFSRVTLHLRGDKTFVVNAVKNSAKNCYVQKRQLNGADVAKTYLRHAEIMQGGELKLVMGSQAGMTTVRDDDLPYSMSARR